MCVLTWGKQVCHWSVQQCGRIAAAEKVEQKQSRQSWQPEQAWKDPAASERELPFLTSVHTIRQTEGIAVLWLLSRLWNFPQGSYHWTSLFWGKHEFMYIAIR